MLPRIVFPKNIFKINPFFSLDLQQPTGSVVCDGINGSSMRRKICTETCNSDECNQDLMRLGDVMADNVVKSCKACQAGQIIIDDNGDLHDCAEEEVSQVTISYPTAPPTEYNYNNYYLGVSTLLNRCVLFC